MSALWKKTALGVGLAATALASAAPAQAQRYWHRDRGGDTAAGALIGGVIGLGLGAAIASSNRGRYYDRGYYGYSRPDYYYDQRVYVAPPPPPPRVYYEDRYYAPPPRVYYAPRPYYRDYRGYGYNGW